MSGWTRCCTSWLSWDVIYIYMLPPLPKPMFCIVFGRLFKAALRMCMQVFKAEGRCIFWKLYAGALRMCMQVFKAEGRCMLQFHFHFKFGSLWWTKLGMCEDPHVPGNYEPGDYRRQHETSLDILLHMAGNIVSRVHIWARPQWMSLREATDSGIDWYLLVLDQASLQRSAGKKVELFSPCEAEGSIWTFPTFGCQTWERAWNSIWLERMIMQRLSPVAVVVAEMWSFWTAVFGHSLHLVMRYGRGHWIAFGWKGCRGWVLLLLLLLLFLFLFLLLGCEVYEALSIYCWKAS